jgi:hypothetical protein
MNATHYTITSDQGSNVFHAYGRDSADTYIRHLMNEGVSYSVEVNKPVERPDEYYREDGKIVGLYDAQGKIHLYDDVQNEINVNRGAW